MYNFKSQPEQLRAGFDICFDLLIAFDDFDYLLNLISIFRKDTDVENDLKSGPTSIHVSEICDEDLNKNKQTDETYPIEVVEALRAEIYELKEWKSRKEYTNQRTFFSFTFGYHHIRLQRPRISAIVYIMIFCRMILSFGAFPTL